MKKITASKVLFIKLGSSGEWEKECLLEKKNVIRFGFFEFDHELCLKGDWDFIRNYYEKEGRNKGKITMYINQLKAFYESPESILWITFADQKMWWCFASRNFEGSGKTEKFRLVQGEWSDKNINGDLLLASKLSGQLLKTQMYQSTICEVEAAEYVVRKINSEKLPEVLEVELNFEQLRISIPKLFKKLTDKDFEIFVDLIFRHMGCQRVGAIGKTQKDIDIELLMPVSGERFLVQVKSRADLRIFREYNDMFLKTDGYSKFFFVVHSPSHDLQKYISDNQNVVIWKAKELSEHCINSGLTQWLIDKVN